MKKQTKMWWDQGLADLENAGYALEYGGYYVAAFLSQQAAEKVLKGLYFEKFEKNPPRIHDLADLASKVSAPKKIMNFSEELNFSYIASRYPFASKKLPKEYYTLEISQLLVKKAEEIIKWVKKNFQN